MGRKINSFSVKISSNEQIQQQWFKINLRTYQLIKNSATFNCTLNFMTTSSLKTRTRRCNLSRLFLWTSCSADRENSILKNTRQTRFLRSNACRFRNLIDYTLPPFKPVTSLSLSLSLSVPRFDHHTVLISHNQWLSTPTLASYMRSREIYSSAMKIPFPWLRS